MLYQLHLLLIRLKLKRTIYYQTVASSQPFFMHLVQILQIIQLDSLFFSPTSLLNPLQTQLRLCSQVDVMMSNGQFVELLEIRIKFQIKFELHIVHFLLLGKEFCKNLLVCHNTPLRKQIYIFFILFLQQVVQMVASCEQGIVLKCIGPSMRILIVGLEQVILTYVLPLIQRLGSNYDIGNAFGEKMQEHSFATTYIALNGIDYLLHLINFNNGYKEIHMSLMKEINLQNT